MSPETVDDRIVRTMKVKCEIVIELEVPEPYQREDYNPFFDIEENHCPGTGIVGGALTDHIERHEAASTCWACALQGKNTILEINGEPVKERRRLRSSRKAMRGALRTSSANTMSGRSPPSRRRTQSRVRWRPRRGYGQPLARSQTSRAALEARRSHGPVDPNVMWERPEPPKVPEGVPLRELLRGNSEFTSVWIGGVRYEMPKTEAPPSGLRIKLPKKETP